MDGRSYQSTGSKCGSCGADLGPQTVWTLILTDDPPQLVDLALQGKINWARCPDENCRFEGGWLWPNTFLFIDVQNDRCVCVTLTHSARQQLALLREALDCPFIKARRLDPERLAGRTTFVTDYRRVREALEIPIQHVELEYAAIVRSIGRSGLIGKERIEALIRAAMETGALSLEADEISPTLLAELEAYQAQLTGNEEEHIPSIVEQIIGALRPRVSSERPAVAQSNADGTLAHVLRIARESGKHTMARARFERNLADAKKSALLARIDRLCDLESHGLLSDANAAAIDSRRELLELIDTLVEGKQAEPRRYPPHVLLEVRNYIHLRCKQPLVGGLPDLPPGGANFPEPSWLHLGVRVLADIRAASAGIVPPEVFEPIAEVPLAKAYVNCELGKLSIDSGQLSGAKLHLSNARSVLESAFEEEGGNISDYWAVRLYAVCLERIGSLQSRFGRLEEAIRATRGARSVYERIGALDGTHNCLREEGSIYLDLDQLEPAAGLLARAAQCSQGRSRADEVRDLANLSNVYRRLRPFAEAEVDFGTASSQASKEPAAPGAPDEARTEPEHLETAIHNETAFARKAGIRVSCAVDGHPELSYHDLVASEPVDLLYRALAVAELNGDNSFQKLMLERLVAVYGEFGCGALACFVLERVLEGASLAQTGWDVRLFVLNRLREYSEDERAGQDAAKVETARREQVELLDSILRDMNKQSVEYEGLRGEKACLLEALGQWEDAHQEYCAVIQYLERARGWMRDSQNKKGLQSRRWKPYIRAARNCLSMLAVDSARTDLLLEVWHNIQSGRSRALLDVISDVRDESSAKGSVSARPRKFQEVTDCLPKDSAILEYFLMPSSPGCPGSWAMLLIEPGARLPTIAWQVTDLERVLEARNSVSRWADAYDEAITQGNPSSAQALTIQYESALERLADTLIPASLLEHLRTKDYRQLVIVADAYLHDVPFAALKPFQGGRRAYLGLPGKQTGFRIVYAPSSSIFAEWMSRPGTAETGGRHKVALFVDPLGDLERAKGNVTTRFSLLADRLRETQIEVAQLAASEATPPAWLREIHESRALIYFGHSIADARDPESSALMLNDGAGAAVPLSAADVYRESSGRPLCDHGPLIVLASCSGGLASSGGWESDRELVGLSVAHLHAGAGATIAASRPLFDVPALTLLESLLTHLLLGCTAAESLTEAQKLLAQSESKFAHPHFWGFIGLMGSPDWSLPSSPR